MKPNLRTSITGGRLSAVSWIPFLILWWLAPCAWAASPLPTVQTPTNPFFGIDRVEVKIVIFVVFVALSYAIGYLFFQMDLGKRKNPIQATASSFAVAAMFILVSAFLCFSEHTARDGADPQIMASFGLEYLKQINPLPWLFVAIILGTLVTVNYLISRQESR